MTEWLNTHWFCVYDGTHTQVLWCGLPPSASSVSKNIGLQGRFLGYSVQFSRSVVSDSLRPHELQHARPPCPSPTPGVYSDSCPLSQWCHPAISSSRPLLLLPSVPPSIRVFLALYNLLMWNLCLRAKPFECFILIFLNKGFFFFFRGILGLQQNWEESWVPIYSQLLRMQSLFHYQHSK